MTKQLNILKSAKNIAIISLLILALISYVLAGFTPVHAAAVPGPDAGIQSSASITINVGRTSSTQGYSDILVSFSGYASSASITATLLQPDGNGGWVTATDTDPVIARRGFDACGTAALYSNWNLQPDHAYRVQAKIVDTIGSTTYTRTVTSDSF